MKNLKDKSEELMSKKELSSKISKKKSELAPVIKELKALREAIDVTYSLGTLSSYKTLMFL